MLIPVDISVRVWYDPENKDVYKQRNDGSLFKKTIHKNKQALYVLIPLSQVVETANAQKSTH